MELNDRLHESMGRVMNQKAQVTQETAELTVRITTALLDGQDVACLLYSKLMAEKLLESIDIALPEVQRQIDALRPELGREIAARMLAEKEVLVNKSAALNEVIAAANCHHQDRGGDGKIDPEKEQRAAGARVELTRLNVDLFQLIAEISRQRY